MSDYLMRLTDIGRAKDANSLLVGGSPLKFHEFAVGDGQASPNYAANSLQNEVWRGPVSQIEIADAGAGLVSVIGIIPPDEGGFYIRELGLFDDDGDMIALVKTAETERLNPEVGQVTEQLLKVQVQVVNASKVTLIMDPTIIHASREWVEQRILPAYLMACVNALEIDKIKYPQGV